MKKNILLTLLFLLLYFHLTPEIIVKQDKKGKITLSNVTRYRKPKRISFVNVKKSSKKTSIPFVYLSKIKKLSIKHRLRKDLIIAVARAESSFNPNAVSKKGAVGIMQLMNDTAKQYGVSNRYNIDQNLEAGVKHLKYLYNKYNRRLPLTLAAYNAGEEAVKKYRGIPPFKETRTYIRRVMRYMGLGYSSYFSPRSRSKIYKYRTKEGKIVISDSIPIKAQGKIEIID